jgi:glutathione S-transferase
MFVIDSASRNAEIIENNRLKWQKAVEQRFEPVLAQQAYIAGTQFSMADVMVGHTIHFASMLGWVEPSSVLEQYLARLSGRSGFQRAYTDDSQE